MRRVCWLACASVALAAALVPPFARAEEPYAPPTFIGTDVDPGELLGVIAEARSRSFKPVGHTSVVLRMRTVAKVTAAVKVRSRDVPRGYRNEIAAYRIASHLGLDNVPPAVFRRVAWNEIRQRFHEDKLDRRPVVRREVVWDEDGTAPAASIYWVKGMRSVGFEDRQRWAAWVGDGEIPSGKKALAQDFSTMAVFDLLIGNWDRFSGGNLPADASRDRAILRDNDRAFSTPLLARRYDKLLQGLKGVRRFSRSVYSRLERLDEASLRAELAKDPSHAETPLLSDTQIADVLNRRATIVSYIEALVDERGEERVLVFP